MAPSSREYRQYFQELCLIKELVDEWGGYIKNKYIRGKNRFK
jgi:hypothetical protein